MALILVNVPGSETLVRLSLFSNAARPIVSTPSGIVSVVIAQSLNAYPPMLLSVVGSEILVRLVQPLKALSPIT